MKAEYLPGALGCNEGLGGWVMVPVEPTTEMLAAMQSSGWLPGCYRAMLAAAPQREPLTEEQIDAGWDECGGGSAYEAWKNAVRWAERALRTEPPNA